MRYLLGFGSAHNALKAESILKAASVMFRLLPAPKAFEATCGLVLEIDEVSLDSALTALAAADFPLRTIYRREGDDYVKM